MSGVSLSQLKVLVCRGSQSKAKLLMLNILSMKITESGSYNFHRYITTVFCIMLWFTLHSNGL
jgi:hypothetical protein